MHTAQYLDLDAMDYNNNGDGTLSRDESNTLLCGND